MSAFLFLSKALPQLVLPLGLALCLLGLALLLWRRRAARGLVALALAILLLPSTPLCADALLGPLEARYPLRTAAASETADAIIVLGGGTSGRSARQPEVELQQSGMRLLHALRLYQQHKAPLLLLSGGNLWPGETEAEQMRLIFHEWGVPDSALLLEPRSRNTYENAVESLRLCRERGLRRVLLVTSAFHMPRALAIFRHQANGAVEVLPSPTSAMVSGTRHSLLLSLLPDAGALATSTLALRERIGVFIYGLRGWL